LAVEGVGDVELQLRRTLSDKKRGPRSTTIVLRDVLYVPGAVCNILGGHIVDDFGLATGGAVGGELLNIKTGAVVGLLDCPRLFKLLLKGQPKGETSLKKDVLYMIRASWPEDEQLRWLRGKVRSTPFTVKYCQVMRTDDTPAEDNPASTGPSSGASNSRTHGPPYTEAEKQWLKKHYGNEFKFLGTLGLSIYKEEDREEGRQIIGDSCMQKTTTRLMGTTMTMTPRIRFSRSWKRIRCSTWLIITSLKLSSTGSRNTTAILGTSWCPTD
jgi:hypothetical protein